MYSPGLAGSVVCVQSSNFSSIATIGLILIQEARTISFLFSEGKAKVARKDSFACVYRLLRTSCILDFLTCVERIPSKEFRPLLVVCICVRVLKTPVTSWQSRFLGTDKLHFCSLQTFRLLRKSAWMCK